MVKDRIQSKLAGWKSKALSQVGRTTLIKSVATALPQYYMQSLHFPVGWCSQVDKFLKDFWWGFPSSKNRNYTPKAWLAICQPKTMGGLGLRCMRDINEAFLQKLGWNILTKPHSLWVRVLKAKYFQNCSFFTAESTLGSSLVWQGICKVKEALRDSLCYIPRN